MKQRTIDGLMFKVDILDPITAEDCIFDALRIAGPTLAGMFAKLEGKGAKGLLEINLGGDAFANMLREFSTSFDKATYHAIAERLMAVTQVSTDGKEWPMLNTVAPVMFRGKLMTKWRWLAFAAEVNFGGFFGDISSVAQKATALAAALKAQQPSSSPPVSDGAFGGS